MALPELGASIGIALVTGLLVALIWILTNRTVNEQWTEAREQANRVLTAQAAVLAREVRLELLLIDQSLAIIQAAWKKDSEAVNLQDMKAQLPALTNVANDLFIADERRIIRQDILPAAVGQGIGSAYVNFPHGSLETLDFDGNKAGSQILVGETGTTVDARRYLMYVIRPLDHPKSWLVGASFRSEELVKLFTRAQLGGNSVAALIDARRGTVQAIVGPPARRPKLDVSKSQMLESFQRSDAGIWVGDSPMDGVERIHAYEQLRERGMIVTVGMTTAQALQPVAPVISAARSIATMATILVVFVGGTVLWSIFTLRSSRRRLRAFERGKNDLITAQADVALARNHLRITATQLKLIMDASSDGIALFDANLALAGWNARFASACGLPPGGLREAMPMDEFFRLQVRSGVLGAVLDEEIEVAQRIARVRTEPQGSSLPQRGPEGDAISLHVRPIDDGGIVLILNNARALPVMAPLIVATPHGATATAAEPTVPAATAAAPAAVVEW